MLVSISRWHGVVLLCAHMNINVLKDITWNLFIIITIKVTWLIFNPLEITYQCSVTFVCLNLLMTLAPERANQNHFISLQLCLIYGLQLSKFLLAQDTQAGRQLLFKWILSPSSIGSFSFILFSVTRKKSPNVYKSCPKLISLENLKITKIT